jgi:hypothetical protein
MQGGGGLGKWHMKSICLGLIVDCAAILNNNIIPFQLSPAKLLGGDQTISNGAANTSFLLITHQYIGATNQIAPTYWCF